MTDMTPLTGEELAAIKAWSSSPIETFRDRQEFVAHTRTDVVPRLVAEVERLRAELRIEQGKVSDLLAALHTQP
jgi:hypothetical protein